MILEVATFLILAYSNLWAQPLWISEINGSEGIVKSHVKNIPADGFFIVKSFSGETCELPIKEKSESKIHLDLSKCAFKNKIKEGKVVLPGSGISLTKPEEQNPYEDFPEVRIPSGLEGDKKDL